MLYNKDMNTKHCSCCKTKKSLDDFQKYKRSKDGLHSFCKLCLSIKKKQDYKAKWFIYLARLKKYESKIKNIPYDLDVNYLEKIWTETCPIFNVSFVKHDTKHPHCPALDRINPKLGYTKGNVCFISSRANRIKYDATVDELKQVLQFIESH